VSNPPIALGDRVFLINDEGRLSAFKTTPLAVASARPVKEEEPDPRGPPSASEPIPPPGS
jgi:hypothetical protein